jgi:flagellar hook-associated protein 3 FlgL
MMSRNVLADLQDVSYRLDRTRQKLASGKELTRPSDNPFLVSRALEYRGELAANQQYQRNIGEASGWQTTTDTALRSIGDMLLRVRDLTVQAANGATSDSGRAAIAQEVRQLIDGIKTEANAKYAGRYVLSGSATLTAPYTLSDDLYHGDANLIQREIGPGVQLPVNVVGSAVVGDSAGGVVNVLRTVELHLQTNDIAALSADLAALTARTEIGARTNRLETATARLAELEEATVSLLSETEDADMAKTLIDASTQQAVYESALRAGARIVQSSLLDFLR